MIRQVAAIPAPYYLVAFGFFALSLAFSTRAALGLMMPYWQQELDWSRSFISACGATAFLVVAVLAPFTGRFTDRIGPRLALVAGLGSLTIGCAVVALAYSKIAFFIGFSIFCAVGFGLVANHVVSTAIARSFEQQRGLATGIATSGSTAGQFLIVPVIAALLAYFSWRWSFAGLSLACAVMALLILPATFEERRAKAAATAARVAAGVGEATMAQDVHYVIRQPTFHLLFWSFLFCGYTSSGVIETHLMPYAAFCGFPPMPSATAYGVLSAVNLVGMIFAGWLTDRMNRPLLLASIYILRGISFLVLLNVGSDYQTLLMFAVFFGMVDYATVPVTASLAASHIGVRVMGLTMGMIAGGHAIGSASGAFLGGYLYDLAGHYAWVWQSSVVISIAAGLLVLLISRAPRGVAAAA